jgi:glycosyltransferase involved in cell wall biosynthesis
MGNEQNNNPTVEVLVATMRQDDFGLYERLNADSDMVIANQHDHVSEECRIMDGHAVRMFTTKERGLGKNRNTGLEHAAGEICLIADDDIYYTDDYVKVVRSGFDEISDADIILFNVVSEDQDEYHIRAEKIKRIGLLNFARYGSVRYVLKRQRIMSANLRFELDFGSGGKYSTGEDVIFLRDALRAGLKIYTHPGLIAVLRKSESTWFTGYNEKYFFDMGAVFAAMFPVWHGPILLIHGLKLSLRLRVSIYFVYKYLFMGTRGYKKGLSYSEMGGDGL